MAVGIAPRAADNGTIVDSGHIGGVVYFRIDQVIQMHCVSARSKDEVRFMRVGRVAIEEKERAETTLFAVKIG